MELYIDYEQRPDVVEGLYAYLWDRKADIETAYGEPLTWEELPGKRASRIAGYGVGDVSNVDNHDEYIEWFFETHSVVSGPR